MSIEQQITTRLKEAMKSKNQQELGVLRMVKTQAQAAKTAPGFTGETDDAFWLDMIAKYVKQQKKAIVEFEKAESGAEERIADLKFEIAYLEPFLPQKLGEDAVRELVKKVIADAGITDAKMSGRVVGMVMKDHKDSVDAQLVKRIAAEELG